MTEEASTGGSNAAVLDIIADLFATALGLDAVGLDDDFFELGGKSLEAVRMLDDARRALGIRLPLAAIYAASTPRRLASRMEAVARVATRAERSTMTS